VARIYYDTTQRVYQLFKKHPALSQMYEEFGIDIDGIKRVAEFFILNHDKIVEYDLQTIYKSKTPTSFEPDQDNPVKGEVTEYANLPTINLNQGDIYFVSNPYPGKYYIWDGFWAEDPESRDKSRLVYLDSLYQQHGYKVWEDESGYFMAVEDNDGNVVWEKVESTTAVGTVIRISDLMPNPILGDIYEVLGEDLIDIIASLYGLVDMGMSPPWNQYQSALHTNLLELLNMTVYLYRYGVTDNFYEKNIWQFIPEYDRDLMKEEPKIKLFMESIGRKLDQLEDKLIRLQDVYDIDETPDELLEYLGQMLGYEKEDFALSNVSFRELLKNIIEIYKIKGTNYSFSFFFKFLGFNVNLKEFYFNRDVKNPEGFPSIDVENVEYYLTTLNPIYETDYNSPAPNLEQIRNLNDWSLEYDTLLTNGCSNPVNYMLGVESYNNLEQKYHSNPWKYFKTNLIEYQLNPFFDKVNLSSTDNETIKKYIRFLSPTYLFTWVNINLLPWIENVNIMENVDEYLEAEITKTFGNTENGEFFPYENVEDYFYTLDGNNKMSYMQSDSMFVSITNNMNLGGDDTVGAFLKHDGVYIRQPGHPSHITNVYHNGAKYLNFDNLDIVIKNVNDLDYDDIYINYIDLPTIEEVGTIAYVEETNLYYIYKDPAPIWELVTYINPPVVAEDHIFSTYSELILFTATDGDLYKIEDSEKYYIYHNEPATWFHAIDDRYNKWLNYSYRPYPSYPINVVPAPSMVLGVNNINFIWEEILAQEGYWIQVSKDINFSNILLNEFLNNTTTNIQNVILDNDNYYWRIRTKNNLNVNEWSIEKINGIEQSINELLIYEATFLAEDRWLEPGDTNFKTEYFTFDGTVYTKRVNLTVQQEDRFISLLAITANKFDWGQWSPIYRFEINSILFPYDGQILNDLNYQYIEPVYEESTGVLTSINFSIRWKIGLNVEKYEIIVARDVNFTDVVFNLKTTSTEVRLNLPNNIYYWAYKYKKHNKDWSDYQDIMQFTIDV